MQLIEKQFSCCVTVVPMEKKVLFLSRLLFVLVLHSHLKLRFIVFLLVGHKRDPESTCVPPEAPQHCSAVVHLDSVSSAGE